MKPLRAIVVVLVLFLGIAGQGNTQEITDVLGWGATKVHFPSGGSGTADTRDIDLQLDKFVVIYGPGMRCSETGKTWRTSITSGRLPPGLKLILWDDEEYDVYYGDIAGFPEATGRWIVTLQVDDVRCGGKSFSGFQQKLIFNVRP